MDLLLTPARPEDCFLAFGIPISVDEYRTNIKTGIGDFAARHAANETEYRWAIVDDIELILPAIEDLGVHVYREVSLDRFRILLDTHADSPVILFSHWRADHVEFADGLKTVPAIVDNFPKTFCGILDLSICHPVNLVKRLLIDRPIFL